MDDGFQILSWGLATLVLDVTLVLVALLKKREPSAALGWSLAIIFLPGLGAFLFLLFGFTRIPRRLHKKIAHKEVFETEFEFPGALLHPSIAHGQYDDNRWGQLEEMLADIGGHPRCGGNELEIFDSGRAAFNAMCSAIADARDHVHLQYFIFRPDHIGNHVLELLEDRLRAGCEVRFLIDGVGSFAGWSMTRRIQRAGGEASGFMPSITSLAGGRWVSPHLRNHRKTLVVDGRTAFFGGLNVGDEYVGDGGRPWHDLHARLEGPAVRDLQRIFAEDWNFAHGGELEGPRYFPDVEPRGSAAVQIIAGGPDTQPNPIQKAFFGAVTRARRQIKIASPYLVPDAATVEALKSAALGGVDVIIVTQDSPADHKVVHECGLYYSEELTAAGVRIYACTTGMMHAKALAADGEWAMVGTANLDNRSLYLNFEQMAIVDRPNEVAAIETQIDALVAQSRALTLGELQARPWYRRLGSRGARLLAPLL